MTDETTVPTPVVEEETAPEAVAVEEVEVAEEVKEETPA